jgi:hypothetical protein
MGLFTILCIINFVLIDWNSFFLWDALPDGYDKFGLTLREDRLVVSFLVYWLLHSSPMHLIYILVLLVLGLDDNDVSMKQGFLILIAHIIVLPLLISAFSYVVASLLQFLGSGYMMNELTTRYYMGASIMAWSFIGLSRRKDKYVYLAWLFPLVYKLVISGVLDFTPDIAHLSGWIFGYFISQFDYRFIDNLSID